MKLIMATTYMRPDTDSIYMDVYPHTLDVFVSVREPAVHARYGHIERGTPAYDEFVKVLFADWRQPDAC